MKQGQLYDHTHKRLRRAAIALDSTVIALNSQAVDEFLDRIWKKIEAAEKKTKALSGK